ncbi:hypothetical protein Glove_279g7 [Diversispora epigaea]|uniref:Uncharacterized protein n=1 Tax=Diversispora epigaea TaxID=1348612 RepID=A0A397I7I8_9GLOM|nr:hypothetical protein Glove_279g7 [Diversispora epigaea]
MGVCFVGKKKTFSEFLEQYLIGRPGDIKTLDGKIVNIRDNMRTQLVNALGFIMVQVLGGFSILTVF